MVYVVGVVADERDVQAMQRLYYAMYQEQLAVRQLYVDGILTDKCVFVWPCRGIFFFSI